MSNLGLAGIFSGIDTELLVAQTMAANRLPLNRLEARKALWQAKDSAVDEIAGRLGDLEALVDTLRDDSNLRRALASTSDANVLYATASDGAGEGTFQVEVNRLASAEREIHAGLAVRETWTHDRGVATADDEYLSAEDISDNAGEDYKFVFQFGSEDQVVVDLSAYDATGITLNQLVSEINTAAGYGTGQAASAVIDGGQYKLRIQAENTGSGHDLVITDDNSVGLLDATDDFEQTSDGDVGSDSLVGAGQFVYTYNGVTRTIVTTESTTLGQLRDLINNDGANPGVTATTLEYEVDSDHVHHLVLTGNHTGSDYAITIETDTTLSTFGPGGENWTEQAAQDSQIRVDGYPAGDWIERSSNSISDVIPNVTLNLVGVTSGTPVSVTLSRDTNQLKNDIQNLVSIYNGIVSKMNEYTGFNEETEVSGVLQGDSLVTGIRSRIRGPLISSADGFEASSDPFTLASQLGIEIDRDGLLTLDTAKLDDALESDYYGVLSLVGAAGNGGSNNDFVQFNSANSATTAGTYEVEIDFDDAGVVQAARIRTNGETEWRDAMVEGDIIQGEYGNPEQYLTLQAIWDTSKSGTAYTESGEVRVKQGFAGAIYDELEDILDTVDGTIITKKDRIESAIDIIDKQIDIQERRLEQREERLRAKYARLEATLSRLDSMRAAVDTLVAQVSSMNSD